jgi:prepilin-type N-terminal cleavage/methylation domain-containing protein
MIMKRRAVRLWRDGSAFTIIEVLIVLAIAGLILVIVFLAVPNAQRNYRNERRKKAVAYVFSEMQEWYAAHGRYPEWGFAYDNVRDEFVETLTTGPAADYTIRYADITQDHEWPYSGRGAPANLTDALDTISIMHGHQCTRGPDRGPGDTDYPVETGALGDLNYHGYAVWTLLEGGRDPVSFCQDTTPR